MIFKQMFAIGVPLILSSCLSLVINQFRLLVTSDWLLSLIFFTSFGVVTTMIYSLRYKRPDFTAVLLGCLIAKLLLSLVCIVVYSAYSETNLLNFAIQFLIHFVFFTIFEIRFILLLINSLPGKGD